MSIFGDIANVVSSVAHGAADLVGDVAHTAAGAADSLGGVGGLASMALGMAFPPLGLATSAANLLTQGVGQAVNQAMQGLCKEAGMPSFLLGDIAKLVSSVVGGLTQPSHPACDQAVNQQCGGTIGDLIKELTQQIQDAVKNTMQQNDQCHGKGGGKGGGKASAGSWMQAIASAMGEAAGKKASQMVDLSQQLNNIGSGNQAQDAQDQMKINAQFQAASQEFNMLQSAFSNAIKGIGEGAATMARKG